MNILKHSMPAMNELSFLHLRWMDALSRPSLCHFLFFPSVSMGVNYRSEFFPFIMNKPLFEGFHCPGKPMGKSLWNISRFTVYYYTSKNKDERGKSFRKLFTVISQCFKSTVFQLTIKRSLAPISTASRNALSNLAYLKKEYSGFSKQNANEN